MERLLLWVASSTLLALVQSCVYGHLNSVISFGSLCLGALIAVVLCPKHQRISWKFLRPRWSFDFLLMAFILSVGTFQFINLLVIIDGRYAVGNPNNLGDLPLHINYIRAFAGGLSFWPENTEFSGEILKYPFAMDLWNALFESLGVPLRAHLFITGLGSLFLTVLGLYVIAGTWGVAAFFLSGGFVGTSDLFAGSAWLPGSVVDWKNLFLAVFVTQRGFLYALPAGLWLIKRAQKPLNDIRGKVVFAGIWGSLAFFHLHSFFILTLVLLGRSVIDKNSKSLSVSAIVAGLISLPILLIVLLRGSALANSIGVSWIWTFASRAASLSIVEYLRINFLVVFAVFSLSLFYCLRQSLKVRRELIFLLLLWLVFFNVKVAPWGWDNIKVLLWIYLLIYFWFYEYCYVNYSRGTQRLLLGFIFLPGFFQLVASLPVRMPANKIGPSALVADCQRTQIDVNQVVVSAGAYDHPLYFQGRKMALGYEGHVWSHGYDLGRRKLLVDSVITAKEGWPQAAKELGAKWLLRRKNDSDFLTSGWSSVAATAIECEDLIYDLSKFVDDSGRSKVPPPVETFDFESPREFDGSKSKGSSSAH